MKSFWLLRKKCLCIKTVSKFEKMNDNEADIFIIINEYEI